MTGTAVARPALKWVGGKGKLLGEILPRLPVQIDTYYEPFIGGGAVFFALAAEKRFRRAVISDRNPELAEFYTVIRDRLELLIPLLADHREEHARDPKYHYDRVQKIGSLFLNIMRPEERAARTIYLNKTGFNGLYRQNTLGEFNTSLGDMKNPAILDEPNLRLVSAALAGVEIRCCDFAEAVMNAKSGDAVYFDPPYLYPEGATNFIAYGALRFVRRDHVRLAEISRWLNKGGIEILISNDSNADVREVFAGFELVEVDALRSVNNQSDGRGPVKEVLLSLPRCAV